MKFLMVFYLDIILIYDKIVKFTFYVENVISCTNRLYHWQQFAHIFFKFLEWKAQSSLNSKDHPHQKKSFLHDLEYFQV